MDLFVRPGADAAQKELILQRWYREQLKLLLPAMAEHWQFVLGVQAAHWGIKKMKTRWGSCNIEAHRVWINLELAKKPVQCLEYIVVHELMHLLERQHSDRFMRLMDQHLPDWRSRRVLLNESALGHEHWDY